MSCLRVAAPPSPLGVSTPRDLAGKDHGHGMVGLPPVLSARRQKASVSAGGAFSKAARA